MKKASFSGYISTPSGDMSNFLDKSACINKGRLHKLSSMRVKLSQWDYSTKKSYGRK